jgi:hypothetical protein
MLDFPSTPLMINKSGVLYAESKETQPRENAPHSGRGMLKI